MAYGIVGPLENIVLASVIHEGKNFCDGRCVGLFRILTRCDVMQHYASLSPWMSVLELQGTRIFIQIAAGALSVFLALRARREARYKFQLRVHRMS